MNIELSSKRAFFKRMVLAGVATAMLAAPLQAQAATSNSNHGKTIVDIAVGAENFKTLVAALQAAGLVETLQGKGPFTVFAPTDEAFAKLPSGTVENLLKPENKNQLIAVLTYHVASGRRDARSLAHTGGARSLQGAPVNFVHGAEGAMVNNAKVTTANIRASNGIVHVIDQVILPPEAAKTDIVDTAVAAGSFKTLAAALGAAGLVETLKGAGPFTVFAPTDDAFAKLPAGTVDALLKPENKDALVKVLTYHVVAGNIQSSEAIAARRAKTVQGGRVTIIKRGSDVFINKSKVVSANVLATNGVIHVIDTVLLPAGLKLK
jgi:uncharacterized surface protein with fasciclin (FAS1) repeats